MRRIYPLSEIAKTALSGNMGAVNGPSTPYTVTQLLVDGDAKDGYKLYKVDNELCGFNLFPNFRIRSFYAVQEIRRQLNETGTTTYFNHIR